MSDYERWEIPDGHPWKNLPHAEAFRKGKLAILITTDPIDFFGNGQSTTCRHLSISAPDRYPTWAEIKDARYRFFDKHKWVYQVFPPIDQWLNVHPNCFHLFQPLIEVRNG